MAVAMRYGSNDYTPSGGSSGGGSGGITIEEIDCGIFVAGYLSNTGVLTTPSSTNKEMTSDYFAANQSDTLFFLAAMPASHSQWIAFSEYDSSKNFISRRIIVDSVTGASSANSFRPSSTCAYCRVSIRTFGGLNWTLLKMPVSNNLTGS